MITVTGTQFQPSPHLHCRFESLIVPATYITASQLRCVQPAHGYGNVSVEVSNNNQARRYSVYR